MKTYAKIVPEGLERPGDLLFQRGTAWTSLVIRFSQLSSISHAGILIEPAGEGKWIVAEAINSGFVLNERELPGGYIVRMPGNRNQEIMYAARRLVDIESKYDWLAIGWHAGRFLEKYWPTYVLGQAIKKIIRPRARRKDRLICSEAVLIVLRAVGAWPELIGRFDDLIGFEVSPVDLWRAIIGHRD